MLKLTATPILFLALGPACLAQDKPEPDSDKDTTPRREAPAEAGKEQKGLTIAKAVVCRTIDGFEKYEPLPGGALTSEEKLQVYYHPLNYEIVNENGEYRVHLVQDGQIRRRGEKSVLRSKKNILEYAPKSRAPLGTIFLRNSVPLKGFPPGDYEYDIILRDENRPGPTALRSVKFKIVRAELPAGGKAQKKGRARKGSAGARRGEPGQAEGVFPPEVFEDPDDE
jgi:hypothetical protein